MRELNPKLWDGLRLKPEVRKTLLKNALAFKKFMDAPGLKIDDVLLVGSSASRWWTKHSDIDLHLVVDFEQSVCPKWADGFFNAQKSLWNQTHDVQVFGHEVEVYVEDLAKPANSAGAYSLTLDRWIREPTAGEMREDDPSVIAKADALENEIEDMLAGDPSKEAVEELIDRLKRLRRDGLAADGEKSTENWAYKVLRSRKALYKLWAARKQLADDELSLNERIAPRVNELWYGQDRDTSKRMALRNLSKMMTTNDGTRSLSESIMVPELDAALKDWIKAGGGGVIIGGVSMSFYGKPRYTQDVDLLFQSEADIPTSVQGFKRNRKSAFVHLKTHVEIELVTPELINADPKLVAQVIATAKPQGGIKVASPSGIVAMKLGRLNDYDKGDIKALMAMGDVDLSGYTLTPDRLRAFEKLKQETISEGSKPKTTKYYHVTSTENVENILKTGLKPTYGPRSEKAVESQPAVFLFPSRKHAEDAVMNWYGEETDEDEPLALIRVELPNKKFELQSEVPYEFYTTETIPPKYLKVITRNL